VRSLLAPVVSGLALAALLYGLLWSAERRLPEPEDPWLDAFVGDGMKAEFRSLSTEPDKSIMSGDARELFKGPEVAGAVVRNYQVANTSVQVLRMAKPGLVPEIPEGRKLDYRFKSGGNTVHLCRTGRSIAFVATVGKWIPVVGQMKTPKRQVEEIFDAFEETVRRYP
jgi:hypothetical protein